MSDEQEERPEHPDARHRHLESQDGWTKLANFLIPAFIAVLVALAGQGVLAWRDIAVVKHSLEELADTYVTDIGTLAAIAKQAHANSIHREEHERQAERWIRRIEQNTEAIQALRNQSSARADPFTGTEGAELRRRVDRLEDKAFP